MKNAIVPNPVPKKKKVKTSRVLAEVIPVIVSLVIFWVPYYFILITSFKTRPEAAEMTMAWPSQFNIIENYTSVLQADNNIVLRGFLNSAMITVLSIIVLIFVCSMAGYVLHRRQSKVSTFVSFLTLAGLMIPPAIVPTIWVLDAVGLFKTIPGIVFIEVALAFPFTTILYRSFMASIPREIDEAALIDGCGKYRMFFKIIFPLLKPVTATVIVLTAVTIFNDFVNPLYFLPGADNVTVQTTLYAFRSRFVTDYNLLFADIVLISLPPLILFLFFNKKIVAGMTSGAIKG